MKEEATPIGVVLERTNGKLTRQDYKNALQERCKGSMWFTNHTHGQPLIRILGKGIKDSCTS